MDGLLHALERKYLYSEYPVEIPEHINPAEHIWSSIARFVSVGSYVEALKEEECQFALKGGGKVRSGEVTVSEYYKEAITAYLRKGGPEREHIVLCIAIACLQLFTQNNFTGPLIGPAPGTLLPGMIPEGIAIEDVKEEALESLIGDAEGVYSLLLGPEYLILARLILLELKDLLSTCLTTEWWVFRYALIHQRIVDEKSPQLYEILLQSLNMVENNSELISPSVSRDLAALYHIEAGHLHLHYFDVGRAGDHFKKAVEVLQVNISLTGALGKRTKWQVEDRPQLVVKVEYSGQPLMAAELPAYNLMPSDFPKDVTLNDDTRLPKYKFKEEDEDVIPDLRPIEQAIILAIITHKRRSQAADLQLDEETKAYLVALLQYPKNWCLQLSALLLRSRIEAVESRAMQRALTQVEELMMAVDKEEPSRYERLKLINASLVPPHWELQQELAKMLMRLGSIKSALSVFESLHLWEDVITCYNELQMRQRSAEIIRKLLVKKETPKLLCLLGDATDDIECYNKAWELSNYKSGKSQRCLGNYYYVRKEYVKAITHYEKSLELNALQFPVWQRLAYCALLTENWEKCAQAYRRCSVLEPDSFEVWNNLSQAYLKLNEKQRAWKTLQEALRCRMDSWRLWDNFMTVSTSLGYMSHALNAYNYILTLKAHHVDTQILGRIVKFIIEEEKDPDGKEMKSLYKKCCELLGRLTSEVPTHPELWYIYGLLSRGNPEPTTESKHLVMQCFKKSLAATTQKPGWEKSTLSAVASLHRASYLLDATLDTVEGNPVKVAISNISSTKISVQGAIRGTRKGQVNVVTGELVEEVKEPLKNIEDKMSILLNKFEELKIEI